jgi:hypothetical protein
METKTYCLLNNRLYEVVKKTTCGYTLRNFMYKKPYTFNIRNWYDTSNILFLTEYEMYVIREALSIVWSTNEKRRELYDRTGTITE